MSIPSSQQTKGHEAAAPPTPWNLWVSPLVDLGLLAAFVIAGRGAHGLHSGFAWFVDVLWPLVVGWFLAAIVFRIYGSALRSWGRVIFSWLVGMSVAVLLRSTITGRATPLPFVLVLLAFTGVTLLGWRLLFGLVTSKVLRS